MYCESQDNLGLLFRRVISLMLYHSFKVIITLPKSLLGEKFVALKVFTNTKDRHTICFLKDNCSLIPWLPVITLMLGKRIDSRNWHLYDSHVKLFNVEPFHVSFSTTEARKWWVSFTSYFHGQCNCANW